MDALEQARKIFSNFPEEVFALWLDGKIRDLGWPPQGSQWERALLYYPILYWRKIKWDQKFLPIQFDRLGPLSRKIVNGLMETNVLNKHNRFTDSIKNTRERFDAAFKTVIEKRRVPGRLILLDDDGYYEILDGEHRVGAMCAMRQFPEFKKYVPDEVEAWVGSLDPACRRLFGKE
jgi:hypothetical protein